MRLGARWRGLGAALALLSGVRAQPAAPEVAPPVTGLPRVQLTLFLAPELAYHCTTEYRPAVSREQAAADLLALARGLGYDSVDELRRYKPDGSGRLPLEFQPSENGGLLALYRLTERALDRSVGTFHLEPFLLAYKAYRRIDLEIIVGDLNGRRFAYRGLGNYASDKVLIRHHGQGTHHSFAVEVLDPSAEKLDLPPFAPPALPVQATANPTPVSPLGPILLALAAGLAAALVFLGLVLGWRRWRREEGDATCR